MITLDQAKELKRGTILYHAEHYNTDGTPQRWKVNGAVKRWKRKPDKIRVPLKRGLYEFDYLTQNDLHLVCLTEESAMEA